MCEDFRKNMKDNIFVLIFFIIKHISGFALYVYPEKIGFILIIENVLILVALVTVIAVFKDSCHCKKNEEETIENGTSFLETLFLMSKSYRTFKQIKANENKDAEKLISDIKEKQKI